MLPPLTWRGEKSAEFHAGGGGGGWAPFMPNITILIALMLFLVWTGCGGGVAGLERQKAQSALHSNL